MENGTNQNGGTKTNSNVWIIGAIALVAVIAVVLVFMINNGANNPKKVMETYINSMSSGDIDSLMKVVDIKGVVAWENAGKKAEKFLEEYNKISDQDVKDNEEKVKNALKAGSEILKAVGDLEMKVNKVEEPEKIAENMYRVRANVHIKVTAFGLSNEQDRDFKIIVYNGKFISPEDM